jgi:hypothetical protein
MAMKRWMAAGVAGVAAAGAAALVMASTGVAQADGSTSSAYGFKAEGPFPAEPMPFVESRDGSERTAQLGAAPENPLLAVGAGTVTAGDRSASVELLDVEVGRGLLAELPDVPPELLELCQNLPEQGLPTPPGGLPEVPLPGLPSLEELPADDLRSLCELVLTPPESLLAVELVRVSCDGRDGTVEVAGLRVAGTEVPAPELPVGAGIPANPLITVTANRQTENPDGSFTVEGLVIDLGDGTQEITLGSATCGGAVAVPGGRPPVEEPPVAEAPQPVPADVPVTG